MFGSAPTVLQEIPDPACIVMAEALWHDDPTDVYRVIGVVYLVIGDILKARSIPVGDLS
jgi:hypothetical protein